jgi:hypothetical protein
MNIKKLWQLILNNLDTALAILFSIVAAVFGIFGIFQYALLPAIAGTLALLAISVIRDRKARDALVIQVKKLDGTLHSIQERPGAELFFFDRSVLRPLHETIANAHEIYIMGPTLINVFSQWGKYFYFEKLNKHRASIKILLIDPNCLAIDVAAKCLNEPSEHVRQDIERSLSYIEQMLKDGVHGGSIEARVMQAYPNFGMVLIDPDDPDGCIFVEFIGYHSLLEDRPHIELTRKYDPKWYEYFSKHLYELWGDSEVRFKS